MEQTIEERRAKDREYYAQNREKICERQRKRYKKLGKRDKKRLQEKKREWYEESEKAQVYKERRKREYNTEEYRAKRRADYAAKHVNDPMTEHRRACIEAAKKRMETPLDERKAEIMAAKAEKTAKKDMQEDPGFMQAERESERKRETVIKYIDEWTKRKIFASTTKGGLFMSEADINVYHKEACKYFEIQSKLDKTDPKDYTTRNILSYKLRVIEEHFNTLLNQRLSTKKRLKSE